MNVLANPFMLVLVVATAMAPCTVVSMMQVRADVVVTGSSNESESFLVLLVCGSPATTYATSISTPGAPPSRIP